MEFGVDEFDCGERVRERMRVGRCENCGVNAVSLRGRFIDRLSAVTVVSEDALVAR